MSKLALVTMALIESLAVAACSTSPADPTAARDPAVVLSIVPASAATNVDPSGPIIITFNHPMMAGMEMLVLLHEGSIAGPYVPGIATWSADRERLTFVPSQPLKTKTSYALHMSPNLADANGQDIDFGACAQGVGGQNVSGAMMTGGMMRGGSGGGMMGPGWQSRAGAWGYGMSITFTTA